MLWRKSIWFRAVTWLHTPLHIIGLIFTINWIHTHNLDWWEYTGIISGVGTICGFGIGCVHELLHRPDRLDWYLGCTSLVMSMYPHFWIEHNWGHHRNVATPYDPASADLGDRVWWFVPRCIILTFFDACRIEAKILREQKNLPWYSPRNRVFLGNFASFLVLCAFKHFYNWNAVKNVLIIGFITSWICDNTNYIEHYGLRRRQDENGKYEVTWWFHSWDTPNVLTNTLLFKIQRHPDHHTNAGRPYQILRTYPYAPQLPTGYAGCIVLSWIPPLWDMLMKPRIELAEMYRREYEEFGTIKGQKYEFPKERAAVASFDPEVDKLILGAENFYDEEGNNIFVQAGRRLSRRLSRSAGDIVKALGSSSLANLLASKSDDDDSSEEPPELESKKNL